MKYLCFIHYKIDFPLERHQGTIDLPCLKKLSIYACPKLEGVVELVVRECDQLVVSIANYKELSVLCILYCKGVVYRRADMFIAE
ncbi:hypothetical protein RchiOBHm_Chr1g0315511 [Rosa chinensis]|uniref:Uncharacterized protein n=1 Tax=Rosa chinensis TaxID=74649 RepID=A0A2P6S7D4_ROSCH|nr:hypothetical protein RchiOBHm_Chr1g0315511 [Rosa chinensis]